MPFYNTGEKEKVYESIRTSDGEIIQEVDISDYPFKHGHKYKVIGFLPSYTKTEVNAVKYGDTYRFFLKGGRGGGMRIGLEGLPRHLERSPLVGHRIIGRLLDASEQLVAENSSGSILITEPLFCPHPDPLRKAKK